MHRSRQHNMPIAFGGGNGQKCGCSCVILGFGDRLFRGAAHHWSISTKTIRATLLANATGVSLKCYLTVLRPSIPFINSRNVDGGRRAGAVPQS